MQTLTPFPNAIPILSFSIISFSFSQLWTRSWQLTGRTLIRAGQRRMGKFWVTIRPRPKGEKGPMENTLLSLTGDNCWKILLVIMTRRSQVSNGNHQSAHFLKVLEWKKFKPFLDFRVRPFKSQVVCIMQTSYLPHCQPPQKSIWLEIVHREPAPIAPSKDYQHQIKFLLMYSQRAFCLTWPKRNTMCSFITVTYRSQ